MEGAGLHRRHRIVDVAVAGHHDQLGLRDLHVQFADQFLAVHARQGVVGQHDVGLEAFQCFQGRLGAMADHHLVILPFEVGLDIAGQCFVVFNDQNALFHAPLPLPP
ncbi:hypothetical protein D9M70_543960 [compost metagenome]